MPEPLSSLLAAVCADPDDDAPRLAYAAAIAAREPARAELIRLQLARSADERTRGALVGAASARERTLLERHGDDWARPIDPFVRPTRRPRPDPGWRFERGFVAFVRIDADTLASLGERLFQMAPIRHLDFDPGPPLREALASPLLGRLRTLGLPACKLDDDDAVALAANPHLGGVRWLDLRDNEIGDAGVAALAASPLVRAIPIVLLAGNPGDPAEQYALDGDGSVADSWLPAAGAALEARYDDVAWLHLPPYHRQPDRYHAR
ncbi:MAG TPA: leucine-rich repeat domain-containing protein [Kofleriaceae bacterium]|nr:leucine-rich repeat domain-containing protein [Kofleriaceae bacterium]